MSLFFGLSFVAPGMFSLHRHLTFKPLQHLTQDPYSLSPSTTFISCLQYSYSVTPSHNPTQSTVWPQPPKIQQNICTPLCNTLLAYFSCFWKIKESRWLAVKLQKKIISGRLFFSLRLHQEWDKILPCTSEIVVAYTGRTICRYVITKGLPHCCFPGLWNQYILSETIVLKLKMWIS